MSGRSVEARILRHSDQFAHGCDGAVALFAADEPRGARSPTFFRKQGRRSGGPGESHPPGRQQNRA